MPFDFYYLNRMNFDPGNQPVFYCVLKIFSM